MACIQHSNLRFYCNNRRHGQMPFIGRCCVVKNYPNSIFILSRSEEEPRTECNIRSGQRTKPLSDCALKNWKMIVLSEKFQSQWHGGN